MPYILISTEKFHALHPEARKIFHPSILKHWKFSLLQFYSTENFPSYYFKAQKISLLYSKAPKIFTSYILKHRTLSCFTFYSKALKIFTLELKNTENFPSFSSKAPKNFMLTFLIEYRKFFSLIQKKLSTVFSPFWILKCH